MKLMDRTQTSRRTLELTFKGCGITQNKMIAGYWKTSRKLESTGTKLKRNNCRKKDEVGGFLCIKSKINRNSYPRRRR
jgi:hypothetical protein